MCGIDEIIDMLDWNNSKEIQEEGRNKAKSIRCLSAFLQPYREKGSKEVWDNCAVVLSERSDEELRPYLQHLFAWLEDMNWPGAYCILDRLKRYKKDEYFKMTYCECVRIANAVKKNWLYGLDLLE